jgi:hypothetical protein
LESNLGRRTMFLALAIYAWRPFSGPLALLAAYLL